LIPEKLAILKKNSNNFWFSWNPSISELFQSIDFDLWQNSQNNPYRMLIQLNAAKLLKLSNSKSFMSRLLPLRKKRNITFHEMTMNKDKKAKNPRGLRIFAPNLPCMSLFQIIREVWEYLPAIISKQPAI